MSEDERRLSDEIRDAKASLYSLLLLSSETNVHDLTDNEIDLMFFLSKDKQIQELFKPKPEKPTDLMDFDLAKLQKRFIVLLTTITDANYLTPLEKHEILQAANKLYYLSRELIIKSKTNEHEHKPK